MTDELLFKELIEKIDRLKPEYPAWLSVRQVAEYLGVSQSQIRKLIGNGSIPYRRVGQALRFNRRQIDLFLLTGQKKPKARTRQTFEALLD